LYGSKSCVLRNRSARSKICIGHHVFDDNGPLLPRRPAAGRDVIGLHALEELQKFAMEAVLRLDCEIARPPVHKLDISEAGSGQLQADIQNAIKYRAKPGTAGKSLGELS